MAYLKITACPSEEMPPSTNASRCIGQPDQSIDNDQNRPAVMNHSPASDTYDDSTDSEDDFEAPVGATCPGQNSPAFFPVKCCCLPYKIIPELRLGLLKVQLEDRRRCEPDVDYDGGDEEEDESDDDDTDDSDNNYDDDDDDSIGDSYGDDLSQACTGTEGSEEEYYTGLGSSDYSNEESVFDESTDESNDEEEL